NYLSGKEYLNDFDDYLSDEYLLNTYNFTYAIIDEQNKIFILYGINKKTGDLVSFGTSNEGFTWQKLGKAFLEQLNPWEYGQSDDSNLILMGSKLPRGWINKILYGTLLKKNLICYRILKPPLRKDMLALLVKSV
ncbi:MAG: hypothetical protein KDD04_04545, partial [Sinomicrobium sp.]|nr:hypothetical protein [Sinomicrobium sp.]